MSIPPVVASSARPAPLTRVRRVVNLTWSIFLALVCALMAISAVGRYGVDTSSYPVWLRTWSFMGVVIALALAVLIIWRHRFPQEIFLASAVVTVLIPTSGLTMLVALAAVTAVAKAQRIWVWILIAIAAMSASLWWDLAVAQSLMSAFAAEAPLGSTGRGVLNVLVPVFAFVMVTPFAGFGLVRRLRSERDQAQAVQADATRNVSALHSEVERERERQELARELHDTLAAKLSALALHAGAFELTIDGENPRAVQTAQMLRKAAQASLDDLRDVVHVLKHAPAGTGPRAGLADLARLVDEASAEGVDVRAQLFIGDPSSCDPEVSHAVFRLVQESISNARRHAPGVAVRIDVRGDPHTGVTMRAANWLNPAATPSSVGGGNGLTGMKERVQLVGGAFQAGPTPERTFAVVAWLPWARP